MIEDDVEALLRWLSTTLPQERIDLPRNDALIWACSRGLVIARRRVGIPDPEEPDGPILSGFSTIYEISSVGIAWLRDRSDASS